MDIPTILSPINIVELANRNITEDDLDQILARDRNRQFLRILFFMISAAGAGGESEFKYILPPGFNIDVKITYKNPDHN